MVQLSHPTWLLGNSNPVSNTQDGKLVVLLFTYLPVINVKDYLYKCFQYFCKLKNACTRFIYIMCPCPIREFFSFLFFFNFYTNPKCCVRCMVLARLLQSSLFVTLWTIARQAPLSMAFSRQEYWSWLPCPPPGDLPTLGIEPKSLMSVALAGGFFTTSTTLEAHYVPQQTVSQGVHL